MAGDPSVLAASLSDAADACRDLSAAHTAASRVVVAEVFTKTPRRSGRLAATVRADVHDTGFRVVADTPYARPVHAARPWITQALDKTAADTLNIYTDHAADIVATITS